MKDLLKALLSLAPLFVRDVVLARAQRKKNSAVRAFEEEYEKELAKKRSKGMN